MKTHEGVKAYVKEKVEKLRKYVENPREVHVVLAVEKFRHIAEITVVGDGGIFNSQGRDNDLYAAIDQMVDKMERQVRERRQKVRQKRASASSPKPPLRLTGKAGEEKEEGDLSSRVRRRRMVAKPMSLEEALSQLHLSKKDFLVFVNSDSEQMNVVYRSQDGGYGWVEPHPK
jgi:putative sigma-54 modulation protein